MGRDEDTPSHDVEFLDADPSGGDADDVLSVPVAINRSPRRQKAAIVLYYYVELPIPEVASIMKCPLGTVKSALHDARSSLGALLGESYVRA